MNLYLYNRKCEIVADGECDETRALAVFAQKYSAGLQTYKYAEEAMEKASFGISRSEEDFIEPICNGADSVSFYSNRLHNESSLLARIFSYKTHFWITVDRTGAEQVIRDYFQMTRWDFEEKYANFLTK